MAFFGDDKPIVAISTGPREKAALGIVRISGFKDLGFLKGLIKAKGVIEPRKAYFSRFYARNEEVLDEGIYTFFESPNSFTGENILEFSLHGNPLILRRFVDYLIQNFDFREALPGEFSYRALKNKKLNLTQLEGLDLLLNSNSSFGLSSGTKLLNNDLYNDYKDLRDTYKEIKTTIDLLIDFSEDVGEEEVWQKFERDMARFKGLIEPLYKRTRGDIDKVLSPKIVLAGPTNAGKSTLFNRLVGENRAIVSDVHGTTRDYLSEYLSLEGNTFKLIDTAGLRETDEVIEKEGIERSKEAFQSGFFKIFVCNPFNDLDYDYHEESLSSSDAILFTHSDLPGFEQATNKHLSKLPQKTSFKSGPMGAVIFNGPIGPGGKSGPMGADKKSGPIEPTRERGPMGANQNNGPIGPTLEDVISASYLKLTEENPIIIERHKNEISAIYLSFNEFSDTYIVNKDAAILSSLANRLGASLDQLVGIISPQEVLDHIFSNFCIGK